MKHGGDIYTEGIFKGVKLVDFSSNINPMGVPESFKDNIQEALSAVTAYPDIKYRMVKKYILDYLKKSYEEIDLDFDNVLLGNGAAEILNLVIGNCKSICIAVPSFVEYEENAGKWNCKVEHSYLKEDMSYDYEDISRKLETVDAVILGNPNNPNGGIIHKEKFMNIIELCEKKGKLVIIDEAFIEFTACKSMSFLKECCQYKCVFIVRALTKFFALPGIRMGYGISSNKNIIEKLKGKQIPWNINTFAEVACKHVLSDEGYIEESLEWIRGERAFMMDALKNVRIIEKVHPTNSNFVLCKLRESSGEELNEKLKDKEIIIRTCSNFRGLDDSFVRFAIKDRESNLKLINALKGVE